MLMADAGDEGKDRQRRGEMHHTCKCINYAEQSKLSVLVSATKGLHQEKRVPVSRPHFSRVLLLNLL